MNRGGTTDLDERDAERHEMKRCSVLKCNFEVKYDFVS